MGTLFDSDILYINKIESNMNREVETKKDRILRYAKKIKSVRYLGNSCNVCGEENIFKLTFHHRDPSEKEFEIGEILKNRWSTIIKELDKCDILCQNCHREHHYNEKVINDKRRNDKKIYLEYSGNKCIECGYNKCEASLEFHHRNPNEKEFEISSAWNFENKSLFEIDKHIISELDKCDILCSNCHMMKHIDIDFFNENIDEINNKVSNYKERQTKIDRSIILEMHKNGMKNIEIAKYFNASTGTISDAIRQLKIKK